MIANRKRTRPSYNWVGNLSAGNSQWEVFGEAVRQRATAILVAHNHPSGNLEPSVEDKDVTRRLKQAGDILGIKVLDHLIFSEEGYLSMLEGNLF
jgi:DNA repair protein RadC